MVQQAAGPRHDHDVAAVHKHGCWGFISFEATQEEDGRLSEATKKISKTIRNSKFLLLTMVTALFSNYELHYFFNSSSTLIAPKSSFLNCVKILLFWFVVN